MTRALSLSALFAAAGVAIAAWWWPSLPAEIPSHWGLSGQPDAFVAKEFGVVLAPALSIGVPAFIAALIKVDPRQEHVARSMKAMSVVLVALSAFFLLLQVLILRAAMQPDMALDPSLLMAGVGGLFMTMGNALPKFQSNWFAGIRTPWTLQSEAVWHRTHRVAGWCFVGAGLVMVVAAFAAPTHIALALTVGAPLLAAIVPVVYSYVVWSQVGDTSV